MLAYHVDPTGNHDGCMQAFYEAGIYVFLDVDDFATMIVQTSPSWTLQTFTAFTAVIDAFDKYVNVAGFFISNEVSPFTNCIEGIGSEQSGRASRSSLYQSSRTRHQSVHEEERRPLCPYGVLFCRRCLPKAKSSKLPCMRSRSKPN